jgi:hypothetical protein
LAVGDDRKALRAQVAQSNAPLPQTQLRPLFDGIDADKLRQAIMPTMAPIDIERAQRCIDIHIRNVQSAVPRHDPGMPGY